MLGAYDVEIAEERRRQMLREAKQYHLAKLAMAQRGRRDAVYHRTLAWIGGRLVDVGASLQERYGASAERSVNGVASLRSASR